MQIKELSTNVHTVQPLVPANSALYAQQQKCAEQWTKLTRNILKNTGQNFIVNIAKKWRLENEPNHRHNINLYNFISLRSKHSLSGLATVESNLMTNPIIEEEIKIAKENNEPLKCSCGQELTTEEFRENSGLCDQCIRALKD